MRCAIVTRVSTEEQTRPDYNSCQSQQDICRHYVEVQREKGWEVFRVYEDAGYSGRNLKRPGIQALVRDIRRDLIDIVLCTRIDRISRSIRDFYEFWSVLEQHHVTFVSATESFDTSTAAGSLMVNLLLSFGAWEVAVVSERTSMKMLARARKGLWNGGHVPLGYGYSKDEQLLIPDPDESQIVVSVFEALVREGSIAGVRQFANERGYRSKVRSVTDRAGQVREVGGKPFSYDLIRQIVTNPLYKGCVRYGDELFTGNQQPLVSTELWDQANEVLRRRVRGNPSPARTPDSHIHLFKGLLRCGECGASMTPYPSGKRRPDGSAYLYYTCLNAIKHRQHCTCQVRSVPARAFEDAVLEAWERLGSDPSLVERCLVEGSESERQDMARLHRRLEGLRSELRDVDERMRRLLGVFEESESVPEGMKVRLCELDEQQAGLRLEIAQIQHELDDLGGEAPTPQEIADFLRAFTEGIRGLPMAEKKARIRSVIGRLTHNHLPPSEGPESALASCTEGRFRTSRILVMTRINSKPPESADSGGLSAESHNQMASGSGREVVGSAGPVRTRVRVTLSHAVVVRHGRELSRPAEPPRERIVRESPTERAERFRLLLESGQYRSQGELARALGCTQPWISKALRRLRGTG